MQAGFDDAYIEALHTTSAKDSPEHLPTDSDHSVHCVSDLVLGPHGCLERQVSAGVSGGGMPVKRCTPDGANGAWWWLHWAAVVGLMYLCHSSTVTFGCSRCDGAMSACTLVTGASMHIVERTRACMRDGAQLSASSISKLSCRLPPARSLMSPQSSSITGYMNKTKGSGKGTGQKWTHVSKPHP